MRGLGPSSAVAPKKYKLMMFDNTARIKLRQKKEEVQVKGLSKLNYEISYSVLYII